VRVYVKFICAILVVLLIYMPVSAAFMEEIDEDNFPLYWTDTAYRMESLLLDLAQFDEDGIEDNLNEYSDMSINWAAEYIAKLSFIGVINGYVENVDGSQVKLFRQFGNVKVSEFIKMALCSMGYELENAPGYWAQNYIDKAIEEQIILEGGFDNYDRPILREEAASIMVMAFLKREQAPCPNLVDRVRDVIKDYSSISDDYKHEVLQSYAIGLITGVGEGLFKPKGNLTRQEACAVIMRFLEPELRLPYEPEGVRYVEMASYYGRTVRVYAPEGKEEYLDAAIALDNARTLSEGAHYINYVSHVPDCGAAFFKDTEDKNRFLNYQVPADVNAINMGISIYNDTMRNYAYAFDLFRVDEVTQYHMDVISEMFTFLFEGDFENAWDILENCIGESKALDENEQVEFIYNNRNGRIVYGPNGIMILVKAKGVE
jgi:hypothetical protein